MFPGFSNHVASNIFIVTVDSRLLRTIAKLSTSRWEFPRPRAFCRCVQLSNNRLTNRNHTATAQTRGNLCCDFPQSKKKKSAIRQSRDSPIQRGKIILTKIAYMQVAYSHFLQSYHGSSRLNTPYAVYSHYGQPTSFQWAFWNGSILKSGPAAPHPTWFTMRCAVGCFC